ncbi:MAG: DUF192 domain-containing protein [Planctomycetota bacterium]
MVERGLRMVERKSGRVLMPRVNVAKSLMERTVGLLGRKGLEDGEGLYFPNCSSIHMFFMKFAIDVVYFDSSKRVTKVVKQLRPWRVSWCPGAQSVLEAPAGWTDETQIMCGIQVMFRQ